MTTAKRQSISDFLYYSICQGQREIGPIGYSPLPVNLVEAGFGQIAKLQAADPGVDLSNRDISTCGNPTFVASNPNENYLAQIAPMPPACDKVGATPCAAGTGNPESLAGYLGTASASGGGKAAGSGGSSSTETSASSLKGKWRLDKATGQLIPPNGLSNGSIASAELPVTDAAGRYGLLALAAAALVALAVFLPTFLGRRLSRRREEDEG
jgi:hypothetical protein